MSLIKLYIVFVKIGLQLLGGGYVILPLLKREFIEKYNVLSEEELLDFFAICQCLPGLIAINVSIFLGNKIKGKLGALMALLGIITTPFLIITILANVLLSQTNNKLVQDIFWGIRISVIALIFMNVKELWNSAIRGKFSLVLFTIILSLMLFTKISPAILIIFAGICALLFALIKSRINRTQE